MSATPYNPFQRIDDLEALVKDLVARVEKLENRQAHAFGDLPAQKSTSTLHVPRKA